MVSDADSDDSGADDDHWAEAAGRRFGAMTGSTEIIRLAIGVLGEGAARESRCRAQRV